MREKCRLDQLLINTEDDSSIVPFFLVTAAPSESTPSPYIVQLLLFQQASAAEGNDVHDISGEFFCHPSWLFGCLKKEGPPKFWHSYEDELTAAPVMLRPSISQPTVTISCVDERNQFPNASLRAHSPRRPNKYSQE
ncbi:hypothetical protein AAHC03_09561 [Spirometra sp. Aus1]